MQKPILVIGGNGFVGSTICKYAVANQVKILSMSRSSIAKYPGDWESSIEHVKGDAMKPETYKDLLPNVSGIIHTIGTLIDSRTPLKVNNQYEGSYEHLNRDAALKVINTMQENQSQIPFVFLSAAKGWFFLPGYIETKREVEDYLAKMNPKINYTVLRPGVMHSSANVKQYIGSYIVDAMFYKGQFLSKLGLTDAPYYLPAKTLNVEQVAEAAVKSVLTQNLWNKTLEIDDIESISKKII